MRRSIWIVTLVSACSLLAAGAESQPKRASLTLVAPDERVPDIFIGLRASLVEKFAATLSSTSSPPRRTFIT